LACRKKEKKKSNNKPIHATSIEKTQLNNNFTFEKRQYLLNIKCHHHDINFATPAGLHQAAKGKER
jgi:hypothetical protein